MVSFPHTLPTSRGLNRRTMICSVCGEEKDWGTGSGSVCADCIEKRIEARKEEDQKRRDHAKAKVVFKCTKEIKL